MSVRVRRARAEDVQALLALRCALWPDVDLDRQRRILVLRAESSARHETFVAETDDGVMCGFLDVTRDPGSPGESVHVVLEAIFVTPPSRRGGIARALLAAAERWAHHRGAGTLSCALDPEDARALEAVGWLGFAAAHTRVHLRRAVSAPIEVQRDAVPAPARDGTAEATGITPPLVVQPSRGHGFLVLNLILLAMAVVSFAYTDIYAKDVIRGALLPLLDAAFVIWFLFVFVMLRYRKRADSGTRAERLFRDGP